MTYSYDGRNRVTQIADSVSGSIGRTYDNFDRILTETTPQGSIVYTYDTAGRRETMMVTGQPVVEYTYDDADRLTGVTRGTLGAVMSYDDGNRRTSLTLSNGLVTEYGYDNVNQVTSLTYKDGGTVLGDLTYAYDNAGRRTAVEGTWARTALPVALGSTTYDAANQMIVWGGLSRQYDANGSLASDGATSYSWSNRQQLAGTSGGWSSSFSYDAVGRRTSGTVTALTRQYLYDGLNSVSETVAGQPAVTLAGTDLDEWIGRTSASGSGYFLSDALGSTVALADVSGAIVDQYLYEPFGGTTHGADANSRAFTGRESDAPLYYYRSRFYDPNAGRFLSEDPLQYLAGVNYYAYAGNSPVNWIDPLGLWTEAQCNAARKVLEREKQFGTRRAAKMSTITFGDKTLEPFNSSYSDAANGPTNLGPVQVDWFADIAANTLPLSGLAVPTYIGGKLYWTASRVVTGARVGHPWPFQDPAETNAATAVMMGWGFKDLFTPKLMAKECCGG